MRNNKATTQMDNERHPAMTSALVTLDELAGQLRTTKAALYVLRARGGGPPTTLVGKRLLFAQSDVDSWLLSRREPDRAARA